MLRLLYRRVVERWSYRIVEPSGGGVVVSSNDSGMVKLSNRRVVEWNGDPGTNYPQWGTPYRSRSDLGDFSLFEIEWYYT